MRIDGQCHCGAIAFEAEVDPASMSICHCTDCQTLSGSPFRATIRAPAESFRLTRGTPTTYVKTAESGNRRRQAFCGTCGTPLYTSDLENTATYGLRAGTITQRAAFTPQKQIWHRSALPWVDAIADAPISEKA